MPGYDHRYGSSGSTTGSSSGSTRANAPPGRSSTGHHPVNQGRPGNQPGGRPNLPSNPMPDPNKARIERELQELLNKTSADVTKGADDKKAAAIALANQKRSLDKKNQELYGNKFGKYDISDPMATGFGSVFGASSGTTGSSKGVQDSIRVLVNNEIDKLPAYDRGNPQAVQAAADRAFEKFYPTLLDEEGNETGTWTDAQGNIVGSGNRMLDVGWEDWQGKPASMYDTHEDIANMTARQHLDAWYHDNPGDSNFYWPGGSSGGSQGGSGYGYGYGGDDPLARGYQRAKFAPGTLQEQVNQNYMRLAGLRKKRGGIVSLLELR